LKNYYVYLLTNWNNKVMYVGMTNNLERRVYEHKHKLVTVRSLKIFLKSQIGICHTVRTKSCRFEVMTSPNHA